MDMFIHMVYACRILCVDLGECDFHLVLHGNKGANIVFKKQIEYI